MEKSMVARLRKDLQCQVTILAAVGSQQKFSNRRATQPDACFGKGSGKQFSGERENGADAHVQPGHKRYAAGLGGGTWPWQRRTTGAEVNRRGPGS